MLYCLGTLLGTASLALSSILGFNGVLHCCPQGLSTECLVPESLPSHSLWGRYMQIRCGAATQRNPQAPSSSPILWKWLSTSSALSNPQAHLPLGKSRLIHLNDRESLKLSTRRAKSEVGGRGQGGGSASRNSGPWKEIVSRKEGEETVFIFLFLIACPIAHGIWERRICYSRPWRENHSEFLQYI